MNVLNDTGEIVSHWCPIVDLSKFLDKASVQVLEFFSKKTHAHILDIFWRLRAEILWQNQCL